MVIGFCRLSAQNLEKTDTLSAEEIKLVGVWKVNLPEQRNNLDTKSKALVSQMDSIEEEKFWNAAESRVYALDQERNFVVTWVDEGSHHEVAGNWKLDAKMRVLSLYSKGQLTEFRVEFKEKGQIWIPISKSEKDFSMMYIKGLGL